MGLQMDDEGNFYYAKSARHALTALVPHHGTLLRVSKDGNRTDILATGFRAANGVCLNPDGSFIVTDQEGHWNPKNRINWIRDGGFYGNMFGYHDVTDSSDEAMEQPLCWITNAFDRSPSELLWVESERWGPLNGSLLSFSYGYGQLYVVPHENIGGQMQGGMCAFPLTRLPTGTMRGRFHPTEGQLYSCGMFAWGGNQSQPGGFYRIRYTGKPVHLPIRLSARQQGMEISFSGELDRESAANQDNYTVHTWSLKRTANYGSKHYDERDLGITRVEVSSDGKTVLLEIPQIQADVVYGNSLFPQGRLTDKPSTARFITRSIAWWIDLRDEKVRVLLQTILFKDEDRPVWKICDVHRRIYTESVIHASAQIVVRKSLCGSRELPERSGGWFEVTLATIWLVPQRFAR